MNVFFTSKKIELFLTYMELEIFEDLMKNDKKNFAEQSDAWNT